MFKKLAVAFVALVLLSGCSSRTGKNGSASNGNSKDVTEFEQQVGDRVFFALNSSKLSKEAHETLARQAEWLNNHATYSIAVEGHCDERGTREYNIALGERRAHAVKEFLASKNVSEARLSTISYGKERPAVMGNDEAAWGKNRRGVTVIK